MTEYHKYFTPSKGSRDWHSKLNSNFERIDEDIEVRDLSENLENYRPRVGAKFLATDTGQMYLGNGQAWQPIKTTGREPSFDSVSTGGLYADTAEADAVIRESADGAIATDRNGTIAEGTDVASVIQAAADAHYMGRIVQVSDLTIDGTIELDPRLTYDGLGNTIKHEGDDWAFHSHAPSDNIGAAISRKGGIQNLRIRVTGGGNGIWLNDIVNNNYRDIQINGAGDGMGVGIQLTDEHYWSEDIHVQDIHIRGYTEAGFRIGSADFNCRFQKLSLQTTSDNAVGLDLTNEVRASQSGNIVADSVFEGLMIWHRNLSNAETSPAIRFDTECENIVFRKPQVHPEWGVQDAVATDEAKGDAVIKEPVLPNTFGGNWSEFTLREEPQQHLKSTVGIHDDFSRGFPKQGRQSVKSWDDSAGCPVQQRPRWPHQGSGVSRAPSGITVPPGDLFVRAGICVRDDDWSWQLRYKFESEPSSGKLQILCWESTETGTRHELTQSANGNISIAEYDATGDSRAVAFDRGSMETAPQTLSALRRQGGEWELRRGGQRVDSGVGNALPTSGTQFRVTNDTDAPVTVTELTVGPGQLVGEDE